MRSTTDHNGAHYVNNALYFSLVANANTHTQGYNVQCTSTAHIRVLVLVGRGQIVFGRGIKIILNSRI